MRKPDRANVDTSTPNLTVLSLFTHILISGLIAIEHVLCFNDATVTTAPFSGRWERKGNLLQARRWAGRRIPAGLTVPLG